VTRGWLVVFAKAPVAGRVKTRFSPPFSPAEAASFYRCLLDDVLEVSAAAAHRLELEAVLAVDDASAVAPLTAAAPSGFRGVAQCGGPLGARMSHVAHQAVAAGAPIVLLRGSDSPCLDVETLADATRALARADLAISADRDGGYNLVGLASRALAGRSLGALFDHPMSTPTVLADTLAHAALLALRSVELAAGFDLDRFDDLRWLAAARAAKTLTGCPRTLAFLDDHALWPAQNRPVLERGKPRI